MIFVSAGTGFAPMRAFLWERVAMKRSGVALGEAALFNGIRSRHLDYIYRDEIERFASDGVLDHVHVVTSREDAQHREHVQDRLRGEGALVWRLLEAGGYVYVCGSQPMRAAVRAAFLRRHHRARLDPARARRGTPAPTRDGRPLPPRHVGLTSGARMDALALALAVAALVMFVFAASGRELRRFNEIALGLVFLTAALISQFTTLTNTHIGR